jgi:hypothetical protein
MTKRKDKGERSPLQRAQYRLRVIALLLETDAPIPGSEKAFLINALNRIGAGEDATIVLGVKAARGERKTKSEAGKLFVRQAAISWIAAAIKSKDEGGLGLTFDEAIEAAAEYRPGEANFGLTEDTLRHAVSHNPKSFKPEFPVPIEYLPIRDGKPEEPK